MKNDQPLELPTIGVIAHRLGVSVHRVKHAVEVLELTPVALAGGKRIFDEAGIKRIEENLHATQLGVGPKT
jgi:DNA-binding transcriptional MerR regulator